MKSGAIATFLAALALTALISGTALAQSIDSGCTTNTLYGEYAFRISGQIYGPTGAVVQQRDGVALTLLRWRRPFDTGGLGDVERFSAAGTHRQGGLPHL